MNTVTNYNRQIALNEAQRYFAEDSKASVEDIIQAADKFLTFLEADEYDGD